MLTKKGPFETELSPEEINRRLADAWIRLVEHYEEIRAKNLDSWNKTNHLVLLDFFLDRHSELQRTLPREYGRLEGAMVEAAMAKAKEGESKLKEPQRVELDLSMLNKTQQQAACWRELLATYCRIHGRLKVEWIAWADRDYREFVETVSRLREILNSTSARL
jgi:hypothetical protein